MNKRFFWYSGSLLEAVVQPTRHQFQFSVYCLEPLFTELFRAEHIIIDIMKVSLAAVTGELLFTDFYQQNFIKAIREVIEVDA
ncbi:hypothetical protein [Deminuibacter soli]|uniref:Uncharacterized protein n=1 Tax=Deminuibacter soli TaxID=2291815 RepID=A0A3E1NH95_9BACT|nr:hypothetical protein [Deminuibacter soli]RFM27336.1 hypothetical protein DXN05_15025 [Deminuibacter soli]